LLADLYHLLVLFYYVLLELCLKFFNTFKKVVIQFVALDSFHLRIFSILMSKSARWLSGEGKLGGGGPLGGVEIAFFAFTGMILIFLNDYRDAFFLWQLNLAGGLAKTKLTVCLTPTLKSILTLV
jgi:hypothetical protein